MSRIQALVRRVGIARVSALAFGALVLGAAVPASAQVAPPPVTTAAFIGEGTWKCTVTPDAAAVAKGRGAFTEYVLVESARVVPQELSRQGFEQSAISATPGATSTPFSVSFASKENGTLTVTGTCFATTVSGSLVWTAKDGKIYNYTFTGVSYTPNPADAEN